MILDFRDFDRPGAKVCHSQIDQRNLSPQDSIRVELSTEERRDTAASIYQPELRVENEVKFRLAVTQPSQQATPGPHIMTVAPKLHSSAPYEETTCAEGERLKKSIDGSFEEARAISSALLKIAKLDSGLS